MSSLEDIKSLAPNVQVVLIISAMMLVWLMYRTDAQNRKMSHQLRHIERKITRLPEPAQNDGVGDDDSIGGPTFHADLDVTPASDAPETSPSPTPAEVDVTDLPDVDEGDSGN